MGLMNLVEVGITALLALVSILLVLYGKKIGNVASDTQDLIDGWLAGKVGGEEKLKSYKKATLQAVAAVKQMTNNSQDMTDEEKLDMAMNLTEGFIELAGLEPLNENILRGIVEGELLFLKLFIKQTESQEIGLKEIADITEEVKN